MCGICGFIGETEDKKVILKEMLLKIAHRGPDDEGMYIDNDAALGHRRLSIIDLNNGMQPMYNETGDIAIVFADDTESIILYFSHLQGIESEWRRWYIELDNHFLILDGSCYGN